MLLCPFVNFHLSSLETLKVTICHFFTFPTQIFPARTQTSNSPAAVLTVGPLGWSSCWKSLFSPGCSCSELLVGPLSQTCKPLWQLLATVSRSPARVIEDHHMWDPTEHELCSHCLALSFDHDLSPNVLCRHCLLTCTAAEWGWDNVKRLFRCILLMHSKGFSIFNIIQCCALDSVLNWSTNSFWVSL